MPPFIRKMIANEGTDNETAFGYFRVGLRVGPKAVNDNWDVLLVQAMLRYLYPNGVEVFIKKNNLPRKLFGLY